MAVCQQAKDVIDSLKILKAHVAQFKKTPAVKQNARLARFADRLELLVLAFQTQTTRLTYTCDELTAREIHAQIREAETGVRQVRRVSLELFQEVKTLPSTEQQSFLKRMTSAIIDKLHRFAGAVWQYRWTVVAFIASTVTFYILTSAEQDGKLLLHTSITELFEELRWNTADIFPFRQAMQAFAPMVCNSLGNIKHIALIALLVTALTVFPSYLSKTSDELRLQKLRRLARGVLNTDEIEKLHQDLRAAGDDVLEITEEDGESIGGLSYEERQFGMVLLMLSSFIVRSVGNGLSVLASAAFTPWFLLTSGALTIAAQKSRVLCEAATGPVTSTVWQLWDFTNFMSGFVANTIGGTFSMVPPGLFASMTGLGVVVAPFLVQAALTSFAVAAGAQMGDAWIVDRNSSSFFERFPEAGRFASSWVARSSHFQPAMIDKLMKPPAILTQIVIGTGTGSQAAGANTTADAAAAGATIIDRLVASQWWKQPNSDIGKLWFSGRGMVEFINNAEATKSFYRIIGEDGPNLLASFAPNWMLDYMPQSLISKFNSFIFSSLSHYWEVIYKNSTLSSAFKNAIEAAEGGQPINVELIKYLTGGVGGTRGYLNLLGYSMSGSVYAAVAVWQTVLNVSITLFGAGSMALFVVNSLPRQYQRPMAYSADVFRRFVFRKESAPDYEPFVAEIVKYGGRLADAVGGSKRLLEILSVLFGLGTSLYITWSARQPEKLKANSVELLQKFQESNSDGLSVEELSKMVRSMRVEAQAIISAWDGNNPSKMNEVSDTTIHVTKQQLADWARAHKHVFYKIRLHRDTEFKAADAVENAFIGFSIEKAVLIAKDSKAWLKDQVITTYHYVAEKDTDAVYMQMNLADDGTLHFKQKDMTERALKELLMSDTPPNLDVWEVKRAKALIELVD